MKDGEEHASACNKQTSGDREPGLEKMRQAWRQVSDRRDEVETSGGSTAVIPFEIPDALSRIAGVWDTDIEVTGKGDAAWAWIKASDHWRMISAAENEMNLIGRRGRVDDLNAACQEWIAAWVEAMRHWKRANGTTRAEQRSFNLGHPARLFG